MNFGDILLATLALFVWAALIWMFIAVFGDIFRRRDLSGLAKAGWVFLIVVLPFLGCLFYLIARPPWEEQSLSPRGGERTDFSYTRLSAADEIEKAGKLQPQGPSPPRNSRSSRSRRSLVPRASKGGVYPAVVQAETVETGDRGRAMIHPDRCVEGVS